MNNGSGKRESSGFGAKPIGEPFWVSENGEFPKDFQSLEINGCQFDLGDTVLLASEEAAKKPHVAIIKGICQKECEEVKLDVQWFYRPEDAKMKSGDYLKGVDTRELFYSKHRDGVVAESVMHKATVHFLPLDEKLPERKKYPGFVCQCVYDYEKKILRKLADKELESTMQQEIGALLQKTASHLGV